MLTTPRLESPAHKGKVRDLYDLGDRFLIVASDRISAFDFVLPDEIPHKGEILSSLSLFWFSLLADVVENHYITSDLSGLPADYEPYLDWLAGRSMIVRKADVFPVECIVRGYITGSGWAEYEQSGSVCGHALPAGLVESDKLERPLFTPSTKATVGHDMNISIEEMNKIIGEEMGFVLEAKSIELYEKAAEHAASRGIIIADTKFEFGLVDGHVILVDEVLTPDSSRFWPADQYEPGRSQPSFDKQYVRDWLIDSGWDKMPPAPRLPKEVIEATAGKYQQAYEMLTGEAFTPKGAI